MPYLNLKVNSQPVQTFYREIKEKQQFSFLHEGAVAPHFSKLLQHCGRQFNWTLIEQYPIARKGQYPLKADGALLDEFKLIHGPWEAKDSHDDLPVEVKKKFQAGYPQDNILFQAPDRAMLYQNGSLMLDADISQPLDWRVEKMRLSKDKTQLKYNNFLTLAGIPPEVFEYKLGNRSALDWVIDQYQVSTDARSGIVNDPNNPEDEQYIVRFIGQVITVSLETVKIVKALPASKVGQDEPLPGGNE